MSFVSVIIVSYARSKLLEMADSTRQIIEVQAARQEHILKVQLGLTESAIQSRNIIIETKNELLSKYKSRYEAASNDTFKALDKLIALADSPERRSSNQARRQKVESYFGILSRVVDLGLKHENELASKIAADEAAPARAKLRQEIETQIEIDQRELDAAKVAARDGAAQAINLLIAGAVGGLVLALGLAGSIVTFGITRPLAGLVGVLGRMAEGQIDAEIEASARGDEIGAVGRAVEGIKAMVSQKAVEEAERRQIADMAAAAERQRTMTEMADSFETAVGGIIGMVSSSATELQATAQTMTATATETASQSTMVAAAAEEAASNVNTVAAAAEELGSSVHEIGRQVSGSAELARLAVSEADQTGALVQELSAAVARIGDVVGLISNIAGQTNLLALNATIEAARAGSAGRGFAVVASEVKALAEQTAKATSEISGQIARIQASTGQAVTSIGGITGRIREISGVATSIAAAVEQQGAATQEIVRNVSQAAMGTGEVTSNISGVAGAAEETGVAASQVLGAASELSRQSEHLTAEVGRFLATVRAA